MKIYRIEPKEEDGFYWPYFLCLPSSLKTGDNTYLLVESNNTGFSHDDQQVHETAARSIAQRRGKSLGEPLAVPVLIPAFPRPQPDEVYTHALCHFTLKMESGNLKRLDLQLLAMVEDARQRLKDMGIIVHDEFIMFGYSASGMFANRMALIHPEKILVAAIGAPGGWPTVPVEKWNNNNLPYPAGTYGLRDILEKELKIEELKQTPLFFFMGSEDINDAFEFNQLVKDVFGHTPPER